MSIVGVGSDIEVNYLDEPDGTWLLVSGELDASTVSAFADALQGPIAGSNPVPTATQDSP